MAREVQPFSQAGVTTHRVPGYFLNGTLKPNDSDTRARRADAVRVANDPATTLRWLGRLDVATASRWYIVLHGAERARGQELLVDVVEVEQPPRAQTWSR